MALAATEPLQAQTLFSDTFSDGIITGLTSIGADTLVESGGVLQTASGDNAFAHYTVDATAGLADYTVSVDMMAVDNDAMGVTFRVQDNDNFYFFRQEFGDGGGWDWQLERWDAGVRTILAFADNYGSTPGQVDDVNTWYNIKAVVSGDNFKCYIDDVLKVDHTDATYATGSAGLMLKYQQNGELDNALVLGSGGGGSGASFFYLSAPVDVTPGSAGSWEDVDVSAWVPADATGVILQDVNSTADNLDYGVRKNGSSDTWMLTVGSARTRSIGWHMVGVDSNRIFECYTEDTNVKTYLLGYTTDGVTFFTNGIDKSLTNVGTWEDVDISANTGADTAIGALIVIMDTTRDDYNVGLRMKGSSDNFYQSKDKGDADTAMIGVDAGEVCQMKIENTAVDAYLVGYVTSGAVFFTDAVAKATSTTGSYVDVDITGDIGTDDANGAILRLVTNGGEFFGVRRNGATYDYYEELIEEKWPIVAVDSNHIFEQKIGATTHDLYLQGYTLAGAPPPPTISSAANQSFMVGDTARAISEITVTDVGGVITGANDIRIRIPAGFDMSWDSSDTTAVIGGTASGKVSTTVSYEDSDATLVLNVTSDFAAADVVTVSGLSFANFTALSSAGNLLLEAYDDGAVTATDDKTVVIVAPTYRSIGIAVGTLYSTGDASITSGSSVVTFAGSASLPTNVGQGDKLAVGGGGGGITREQTVNGGAVATSPLALPSINGGTNQTYVLSIATRMSDDVTSVTGGGLTWTEQVEQCAGRGQQGVRLWTAQGSPGSFTVTINWVPGSGNGIAAVLSRYSGVAGFEDPMGENSNGESGGCSGGTDTAATQLTLTSTSAGSVHVIGLNHRDEPVLSYSSGYAFIDFVGAGSGGDRCEVSTYDRTFNPAATDQFQATIDDPDDWAIAGVVLTPSSIPAGTMYVFSRDSATQVTVQEVASATYSNESYTIERAYNTMQAWEDDRDGNLVGESRREIGVCYNDGIFTDRLVVSGSTTDAERYMALTVPVNQRHDGVRDSGARIDAGGGWSSQNAIDVEDEFTRIEWLEITDVFDAGDAISFADSPSADNSMATSIFVHGFWQNSNAAFRVAANNITIRNCFAAGGTTYAVRIESTGDVMIENCTLWGLSGGGYGVHGAANSSVSMRNTICVDHGTLDVYIETAGGATIPYFGYNMYSSYGGGFDPASYAGNNQAPPANLEHLFVDLSSTDLHLEAQGNRAGNTGLDLSGDFTSDIDGDTRADTWDMGADESRSGSSLSTPKIVTWKEIER